MYSLLSLLKLYVAQYDQNSQVFIILSIIRLTLKAPVCFCHLKCYKSFLTNILDPDQTAPLGAV